MAGAKSNPQIVLCPQGLVVLLRLALERGPWGGIRWAR